ELASVQIVEPLYNLTAGLTNRKLVGLIRTSLENVPNFTEWLDPALVQKQNWPRWKEALSNVHAPEAEADLASENPNRMRLAYDELLANQLYLAGLRE